MAVIYEEFIRCAKCNHADFLETKRLTFHKKVRPRKNRQDTLQSINEEIIYVCEKCGESLDR